MSKVRTNSLNRIWVSLTFALVVAAFSGQAGAQLPLSANSEIVVTVSALNVRAAPGTGTVAVVGTAREGDRASVINATPYWADGFWWWEVHFRSGLTGWVAQGYDTEPLIETFDPNSPPRPVAPMASPAPTTRGTGVRAWQTIEFGDSRSQVSAKIADLYGAGQVQSATAALATMLFDVRTDLAGVLLDVYFTFEDDRLHKVVFQTADGPRNELELDYNRLRNVQIAAHGQPTTLERYQLLSPERRFMNFGDLWRRGEVLYRLGLGKSEDAGYNEFYLVLHLEWESLSRQIIQDAAQGF